MLWRSILFTVLSLACLRGYAQKKAAVTNYQRGLTEYVNFLKNNGKLVKAEKYLLKAVKLDPNYPAAWLALGELYENYGDSTDCFRAYENAAGSGSSRAGWYKLGNAAFNKGGYQTCIKAIDQYLLLEKLPAGQKKEAEWLRQNALFAANARRNPSPGIWPRSIKNAISEEAYPESYFFPSISGNQRMLYFTGRNFHDFPRDENIYRTTFIDTIGWSSPIKVEGWINTNLNEGAVSVQGDEQRMVFAACEREDGFGSCDIYFANNTPYGWTQGKNMGANINTSQWETQPCLSADGQFLFFIRDSKRMGSHSNIWMSRWDGKSWSKAEMLPANINGPGDEVSPFLHADGTSLYFGSNSHKGMGGSDLFKSEWQPDGSWSDPVNLGYPINDHLDNFGLVVSPDGRSGFLSGGLLGKRVWDEEVQKFGSVNAPNGNDLPIIFAFELPEEVRANPIVWLEVFAIDAQTKERINKAKWSISQNGLEKEVTHSGYFFETSLPVHTEMAFSVQAPGYNFKSLRLKIEERKGNVQRDTLFLSKTQVGDAFRLNNLLFAFDEAFLLPASMVEIHRVATWLIENPSLRIQVEGHTDSQGSATYNQTLSEKRSAAVVEALVAQGVARERMQGKGFGASRPVASNETVEGQALNRRTEIKILSTSGH